MATKTEQVYNCQVCTNVVKVVEQGVGMLVCCNKPMELQSDKKQLLKSQLLKIENINGP